MGEGGSEDDFAFAARGEATGVTAGVSALNAVVNKASEAFRSAVAAAAGTGTGPPCEMACMAGGGPGCSTMGSMTRELLEGSKVKR